MPLLERNGLRVEYHQSGGGPDPDAHLLLLHSLLTDMAVFDLVLPKLAAARRVTRINLPGFGASGPVALDSVGAHADHVARVMEALGLPRSTDVFGNGFGAFVALELAVRHGARFNRLAVADTLAAFPEPARVPFRGMAEKVRAGGMQAVLDTAIGRMFPPDFAQANPAVIEERKRALAAVEPQCFARACLALAELDLSSRIKISGTRRSSFVAHSTRPRRPRLRARSPRASPARATRRLQAPATARCSSSPRRWCA